MVNETERAQPEQAVAERTPWLPFRPDDLYIRGLNKGLPPFIDGPAERLIDPIAICALVAEQPNQEQAIDSHIARYIDHYVQDTDNNVKCEIAVCSLDDEDIKQATDGILYGFGWERFRELPKDASFVLDDIIKQALIQRLAQGERMVPLAAVQDLVSDAEDGNPPTLWHNNEFIIRANLAKTGRKALLEQIAGQIPNQAEQLDMYDAIVVEAYKQMLQRADTKEQTEIRIALSDDERQYPRPWLQRIQDLQAKYEQRGGQVRLSYLDVDSRQPTELAVVSQVHQPALTEPAEYRPAA